VRQNSLDGTLGTFVHVLEENPQGIPKAVCMELCNADSSLNAEDPVATILEATKGGSQAMLQKEVCKINMSVGSYGPKTLDEASHKRDLGPKYLSESSSIGGPALMSIKMADCPKVSYSHLVTKDELKENKLYNDKKNQGSG
jgi:hypothetical protein